MKALMGQGIAWKWVSYLLLLLSCSAIHAQQTGTVTYIYTDPQGTPLAEADAHGNITATFDYAPYGSQALGTPPSGPGYTGHVNDPESGLVYMQARYYDPAVGRFLSVDPVAPSAGALFGFNLYDYANNNPTNHTDPDGRCADGGGCDQMVQAYGAWANANPAEADKIGRNVAVPGVAAMLVVSGAGEAVAIVKGAAILNKVLSEGRSEANTTVKARATPGADGGRSTITTEKDVKSGDTISVTHKVEVNGETVHQHTDHVGVSGAKKTFSDGLTGNKTIGQGKQAPTPKNQQPSFPPEPVTSKESRY